MLRNRLEKGEVDSDPRQYTAKALTFNTVFILGVAIFHLIRGLSCAYNGNVPVTNTTAKTREIVDSNLTNT